MKNCRRVIVWILSLGAVVAGCTVSVPIGEPLESVSQAPVTCQACIKERCGQELDACAAKEACDDVKGCILTSEGDAPVIHACSWPLEEWASTYPETMKSCVFVRCSDECEGTSSQDYAGYCGFNFIWVQASGADQQKQESCKDCLRDKCCDVGLACGMSLDCWDVWSCDFDCYFQKPTCPSLDEVACQDLPDADPYFATKTCKSALCGDVCE